MKHFVVIVIIFFEVYGQDFEIINNEEHLPYSEKILGGYESKPHSFPFQAGLSIISKTESKFGNFFCGGSLISHQHILTAAHCLKPAKSIEVILGALKYQEHEKTQLRINATFFIIHEKYSPKTMHNDIGIIILPKQIKFTEYVSSIDLCLSKKVNVIGLKATVSGWGQTSDEIFEFSPVLRYTTFPVMKTSGTCNSTYLNVLTADQICFDTKSGKSTCNGDSGGPITIKSKKGKRKLLAVVSFGYALGCSEGYPVVGTYVPNYISWIREKLFATRKTIKQ